MMITIEFRRRDLEKSSFRLVLNKQCIEEGNVGTALISRLNTYDTTEEERELISSFAQQVIDALEPKDELEKSKKDSDNSRISVTVVGTGQAKGDVIDRLRSEPGAKALARQAVDSLESKNESEKSYKEKDNVDDIVDTTAGSIEIVLPESEKNREEARLKGELFKRVEGGSWQVIIEKENEDEEDNKE